MLTCYRTVLVQEQEIAEATRAFKATHNTDADRERKWSTRLSLLKEDRSDYFFRMTYFHQLYQRSHSDILALEMLLGNDANEAE
jgi:hypothetical protein